MRSRVSAGPSARGRAIALVVIASFALTAMPARAAGEGTDALEVCGALRAHTVATATAEGALRVGSRTYPIASGVSAGNGGVEAAVGRELCVTASIGLTSGRLVRYLFFPMLTGDRVCGNIVRPTATESFAMRADFGELTLLRGTPTLAIDNPGMRACYAFQVDATGGDLVATAKMPVRNTFSDRERVTKCGTVKAYVPATAASSGQITIGSRLFRIVAGTGYAGDPAGDRTDRTTVGQAMCFSATLDIGGGTVEYLTREMFTSLTATASAYTPPSGGTPGIAILSYQSRFELRIPAALDATVDRTTNCFTATVDANGDMTAGAVVSCPSGGVTAGTAPPSAAPASPPATPTAPAVPSASLVAVASPNPDPVVTSESAPPWLIAVALLAAAAALFTYLGRRRGLRSHP